MMIEAGWFMYLVDYVVWTGHRYLLRNLSACIRNEPIKRGRERKTQWIVKKK